MTNLLKVLQRMQGRVAYPRWLAVGLVMVFAVGLTGAAQAAPSSPSLVLGVPTQVEMGQPIRITVTVQDAVDIGGYELTLLYDPAALTFSGLHQRNNDLRQLGRDIGSLGPVERPTGAIFGLYSCPFASCAYPTPGSPRRISGGSGTVRLADLSLTPNVTGTVEIKLGNALFVAADGTPVAMTLPSQPWRVQVGAPAGGTLYAAPEANLHPVAQTPTLPPGPFDLTGDGRVTYADSMQVAIPWTTMRERDLACGDLPYPERDVNHDHCLDVVDLQMIAHHYSDPAAAATPTAEPSATVTAEPPTGTPTATATAAPTSTPTPVATATPPTNEGEMQARVFLPSIIEGQPVSQPTPEAAVAARQPRPWPRPAIYALDNFERSAGSGWRSAQVGGDYTLSGPLADFRLTGSAASIALPRAHSERGAALLAVAALNVDATFRVKTDKYATGNGQYAIFESRRTGKGLYLSQLRFTDYGGAELYSERVINGEATLLGSVVTVPTLGHSPDRYVWVRVQVAGTNPTRIRMRAWSDGQLEPWDWQYQVTDETGEVQSPGAVGLRTYLAGNATNAPVLFTFDDLSVVEAPRP